jgi:hypothetical protein
VNHMDATHDPDDWFPVLEGPYYDFDDDSEEDPELSGVPAAFVQRLRALVPTWSALGIVDDDTVACYENDRLRVGVDLGDDDAHMSVGFVRVEISDRDWRAAWVSPSRGISDFDMAEASPKDLAGGPITDEARGVEEAVDWLTAQLRRPIVRYVWRSGANVVARDWRLADTGRPLVGSGRRDLLDQPETADERVTVRP